MSKKVVFSANIGGYDLPCHHYRTQGWEYILFTDSSTLSDTYYDRIIRVEVTHPTRSARRIKILPFKLFKADVSIWVDSNITITRDADEILKQYKQGSFTAMAHNERDCIYDELAACTKYHKDDPYVMAQQVSRYREEGLPEHAGMISSGVLIREHTKEVEKFCEEWYAEVNKGSLRDQLSFNYCVWKSGFKYATFPFFAQGFAYTPHIRKNTCQ